MALIVAGVQCEWREMILSARPAPMLEASPKGTLPVLLFANGTVPEKSHGIMLWALSQSVPAWLNPEAGELDDMLELIGRNDADFKRHLDRYKYPERYTEEKATPRHHRDAACVFANPLEDLLGDSHFPYGPHPSLADIAIFPFVRQSAATNLEWFAGLDLPRLHAWLDSWLQSDLFADAMRPHPAWQPGDPRS